ncbi:hypothetical protein EDB86DRAFT_2827509 [Lactarius hatsudake]|nr:hypothetical protein EDB86DRAFT_2827509 [Lactarius hatsudake]
MAQQSIVNRAQVICLADLGVSVAMPALAVKYIPRALSARSIYGPPLIALAAKACQAGQGAVPTKHLWQGQMRTRRRMLLPLTNQEKRATDLRMRPWREKKRRGGWLLGGQVGWIRLAMRTGSNISPECQGERLRGAERLRQRISNGLAWLVLTFGLRPATGKTLVFSVCNEASFCTPVTPHRVLHIYIYRRIVRKTHRSRTVARPLVPLPFAKGAILSPSQEGRDRSFVPSSSVRISPAPPTRSLRPNHFYFILTASLVTRRRTLVLCTYSGTGERRETDGRTRKTPKVKRLLSIRWDSTPRQTLSEIKTLPPSRRTWAVTSQKFDTSRFDKRRDSTGFSRVLALAARRTSGSCGPGTQRTNGLFTVETPDPSLSTDPFLSPVNLGDDSSFVIRGGRCVVYEDRRYCTRASCGPKPQGCGNAIRHCRLHFSFPLQN